MSPVGFEATDRFAAVMATGRGSEQRQRELEHALSKFLSLPLEGLVTAWSSRV